MRCCIFSAAGARPSGRRGLDDMGSGVTGDILVGESAVATAPRAACAASPNAIWISWERHRRTRELCRSLGIELCELRPRATSVAKYPFLLWETVLCLLRYRPRVLVVQCPSVVLGVWAALLKAVFRYELVVDLHNEAVEPINSSRALYHRSFAWIRRMADLSVVTNEPLKAIVEEGGGRGFVLPDRIPDMGGVSRIGNTHRRPQVVFVCTYAIDEPVEAMLEAAHLVGPAVDIHVTGDRRRLKIQVAIPSHVHLTGFLPETQYEQLLREADVIVDLTSIEHCLVCGAYEAVALEKPLVTSDTRALRSYFRSGTVYTNHDPSALAESIQFAATHRRELAAEMTLLKRELTASWEESREALRRRLRLEQA